MATALSMFCAHKRLRTACPACVPEKARPNALHDEELTPAARRLRD